MTWLKNIVIDLAVTLLVVVAVVTGAAWAEWIIVIYTPLMLIMKVVALVGGSLFSKLQTAPDEVPRWLYHVLYGVNTGLLLGYGWWWVGGQWGVIWLLSTMIDRQWHRSSSRV